MLDVDTKTSSIISPILIRVENLTTAYAGKVIHDSISFAVNNTELVSIIGGSGSGKTTLLRAIIGLLEPASGSVYLFGQDLWKVSTSRREALLRRTSVLFQEGALFSGMTVFDNIAYPLVEFANLPKREIEELVIFWLQIVGLSAEVGRKMPNELSGGMKKRVGLARALILEPEIIFLDEPTSGLDPIAARRFDDLIASIHADLGTAVFMISHDLVSIKKLSTRVIALGEGRLIASGPLEEVRSVSDKWIMEYFNSGE
ncbi:MAG TPA: ATP-binding cassette domain-containing protein [Oligoflexia bacterium]|nr:ATP-binding cassette domain-containing protein [Oligoflexia bacterium]HMP48769.1 ATP-binding cassette domain-containing protein [Oligoflexia bacterium]